MTKQRSAGILLPLFSLPSLEGRGCLDENAFQFIDWLAQTKQSYWQLLPIGSSFRYGNPYSAYSSFGGDPAFLSLKRLFQKGFLKKEPDLKYFSRKLSPTTLTKRKIEFIAQNIILSQKHTKRLQKFQETHQEWLDEFCAFSLLSQRYGKNWTRWPKKFKYYNVEMINELKQEEEFHHFLFREIKSLSYLPKT